MGLDKLVEIKKDFKINISLIGSVKTQTIFGIVLDPNELVFLN